MSSFYRPVYVSRESSYGDYRQTDGPGGDGPIDYETISYKYPRSTVYQPVYNHRRPDQIDEKSPSEDLPEETLTGMKKILVRFADKTSVQGIIYIKEAGRWTSRSVWIFLFLLGTAAVVWQLHDIVTRYLNHPIMTTIDIGYSSLEFPTVTICNMNPLRMSMLYLDPKTEKYIKKQKEKWESSHFAGKPPPKRPPAHPPFKKRKRREVFDMTTQGAVTDDAVTDGDETENEPSTDEDYSDFDYLHEEFGVDDHTAHQDYGGGDVADDYKKELRFAEIISKIDRATLAKMGHQKNETILSCSFNGRKCTEANFTSFVDKKFGNCFQFNGFGHRLKVLKARDAGVIHGLNLIMYKQDREYLPGYTANSGFRLALNEFKTMTFPLQEGFSVPTGVEVSIGFKLVNISRLGEPFWKCDNDDAFLKLYDRKYGISACINTCEDRLVLENCKCIRLENFNNIPIANRSTRDCSKKDSTCVATVKKAMKKGGKCVCLQSCQERYYNRDMSYAVWPNVGIWKTIVDLVCSIDKYGPDCESLLSSTSTGDHRIIQKILSQDFTSLKIFYTQLNYENIKEEESYGMANLAADVGGVLGLWLGFSVFTMFELFYLLLQMCVYAVNKCRRRRGKTPPPSGERPAAKGGKSRVITRRKAWLQRDI